MTSVVPVRAAPDSRHSWMLQQRVADAVRKADAYDRLVKVLELELPLEFEAFYGRSSTYSVSRASLRRIRKAMRKRHWRTSSASSLTSCRPPTR